MALYTVRKLCEPNKRGVDCTRWELYDGERYVTGLEIPAIADIGWYRIAALRLRANLLNRWDDAAPEFGAAPGDSEAMTLAGMLNA